MTIYCTYCGHGFARNEHLQRHVLTHTDLRPFECPVCHLTFKRKDLLKKHFIAHDASKLNLSAQDAELARSLSIKVRSTAACYNCAQTKTKCDNDVKQPCTRCRSKGLDCAARTTRSRGPKSRQGQDRLPLEEMHLDVAADGSESGQQACLGDSESPAASSSVVKAAPSTTSRDGEGMPAVPMAPSNLASSAPKWNMSLDFSCMASFDMNAAHAASEVQRQHAFETPGSGSIKLNQQILHPAPVKMQTTPQPASHLQQPLPMDQPGVFPRTNFQPVVSRGEGSHMYGPSWQVASASDQFFNPASEVFGPFLGFPSPPAFSTETAVVTHQNEDVVMSSADNYATNQESYPPLRSQERETAMYQIKGDERDSQGDMCSNIGSSKGKEKASQIPTEPQNPPCTNEQDPRTSSAANESSENRFVPKDVEHWTMLQCCPTPSTVAPGRAIGNLAFLEENSRHYPGPWSIRSPGLNADADQPGSDRLNRVNVSLSASTRERMSAITSSFFPKALETHGLGVTSIASSYLSAHRRASEWVGSTGYILLPPTEDLEVFLESYMNYVEPYFPLVPTRSLDPNELLVASGNEKGATLLLLLMIAIGATCDPAPKARRLSAGLAELCRISLTDLVEKDNEYSTVPLILQCSLLLTIQSCWGGDKWQMDIGTGHRAIYIAMLRNSGYFRAPVSKRPLGNVDGLNLHAAWRMWVEQEGRRRLAYNWVMLDQEISLFYDYPPMFGITELRAPLPETDEFWLAKSATEWRDLYDHENGPQQDLSTHLSLRPQHSLRRLFHLCVANDLAASSHQSTYKLTPIHLRLLLYPIQSLVFHHSQLIDAFPDKRLPSIFSFNSTARTSTILRLEELQSLLQSWWILAQQQQQQAAHLSSSSPPPDQSHSHSHSQLPLARANFILFHLVALNLYSNPKAIETLARGESDLESDDEDDTSQEDHDAATDMRSRQFVSRCVHAPHEALFHAGQILRLVREAPLRARPPWWAAALYRVSLVLWAHGMARAETGTGASASCGDLPGRDGGGPVVRIDGVLPSDASVIRFLRHKRGVPVVTDHSGGGEGSGGVVRLDDPEVVLRWCIRDALEGAEESSWFAMGVRMKLETLLEAWSGSSGVRRKE